MRLFLTIPDDDAERLEEARVVYNKAHPREPAKLQDLVRDALRIWLDSVKLKQKRTKGKKA